MAEYLDIWPSKRGPIAKIRPSDGCGRDAVPLAVERGYDFPEYGVVWACRLDPRETTMTPKIQAVSTGNLANGIGKGVPFVPIRYTLLWLKNQFANRGG